MILSALRIFIGRFGVRESSSALFLGRADVSSTDAPAGTALRSRIRARQPSGVP
jgi:hypothetical protein